MSRSARLLVVATLFVPLAALSAAEPAPPEGFRAIFNGKDLTGWHGLNPHSSAKLSGEKLEANLAKQRAEFPEHWRVEDGELVNDGHGPYATSDEEFGDIELRLEYKTVPKADSGIYLRGTPQVQIWDWNQVFDPKRPDRKPHLGSGGLFNNTPGKPGRDPLVLADKPFGEWNQFRILQIGDRTSVWLNGKQVVDDAVMENYWDRSKPLPAKGPIMLQTHGGEIRWRNIFVRELPVRIEKDVTYLEPDRAEKADLYLPPVFEPGKKYPGVVIIHGGGWTGGDKGASREINIGTTLASHGYVCMSINYALAKGGAHTFPQNIQECKRAVRWLRKNAEKFQLDVDHIGAIGGSAGGHLTALLAVSGPEVGLDPDVDAEFSCRVQAAVPMYPHCASTWEGKVPPKPYTNLPMFAKPLAEDPVLWDSALAHQATLQRRSAHANSARDGRHDDPAGSVQTALRGGQGDWSSLRAAHRRRAPHSFHLQPKQRDLRAEVLEFFDKYLKP